MPETCTLIEPPCPLERPWSRRHVHAPRGDESFVADPPLRDAMSIARKNGERLAEARVDVQGRGLGVLREWARREVLRAAREYTAELLSAEGSEGGAVRDSHPAVAEPARSE